MASKSNPSPKPVHAPGFAPTRPGGLEPYVPGDALPLPEVIEKDSDSVWALWEATKEGDEAAKTEKPFDPQASTIFMGLPESPKDDER